MNVEPFTLVIVKELGYFPTMLLNPGTTAVVWRKRMNAYSTAAELWGGSAVKVCTRASGRPPLRPGALVLSWDLHAALGARVDFSALVAGVSFPDGFLYHPEASTCLLQLPGGMCLGMETHFSTDLRQPAVPETTWERAVTASRSSRSVRIPPLSLCLGCRHLRIG